MSVVPPSQLEADLEQEVLDVNPDELSIKEEEDDEYHDVEAVMAVSNFRHSQYPSARLQLMCRGVGRDLVTGSVKK